MVDLKGIDREKMLVELVEKLTARNDEMTKELVECDRLRNTAYAERNAMVCALSKIYPSGIGIDGNMERVTPEWRHVIFIDMPTGQGSWHIHETEVKHFTHLRDYMGVYDGHTVREKYERLRAIQPKSKLVLL